MRINNFEKPRTAFEELYIRSIRERLKSIFKYTNDHQIPAISSIIVSSNLNASKYTNEDMYKLFNSLYLLTGKMPRYIRAAKSVSQFKVYKGNISGCKVDMHNDIMFFFLERYVTIYLPNSKDFEGVNPKSATHNAISIPIKKLSICPEVLLYDPNPPGATVTIKVKNSRTSEEVIELLKSFYVPFIS